MKQQSTITTRKIVLTALLAALTFAGSAIRVTMPIDVAGTTSFHLGNIMCALAGLLLGPWYGGLAAAIGSALYDMTNPLYIADCWITFLTKGALGLVTGLTAWNVFRLFDAAKPQSDKKRYALAAIASAAGTVTYGLLYLAKTYIKSAFVRGMAHDAAMLSVYAKMPNTIFNAVVAIIFAPILVVAIEKALKKNHFEI